MKKILFFVLINVFVFQFAFAQQTEVQIKGEISEIKEGAKYEVLLNRDFAEFSKAGHQQNELVRYQSVVSKNNAEIASMKMKIEEASKERRFKTMSDLNKELTQILDNAQGELDDIINNNRGTALSAYLLTNGLAMMSADAMETNFAKLNENEKKSQPGKIYQSMIGGLRKIDINSVAPDFTLPDMDGDSHSLHALEGKLKLIDFWASWCGPCRKENPNMISIYNDFKDKGLLIVGVSLDDNRNAWVKAVETDGLTWLQLSALSGYNDDVVKRYNIDAIPTIYILDANNKIVAKNLSGDKLREFVANYLNNN